MLRFCLLICLLVISVSPSPAEQASSDAPLIRRITIEGNTRTRTEIIRRELLFSTGESLDAGLVAETARNLRRMLFLGEVDIQVREEDGAADVLISVKDLYARALSPIISGEAGELSYGVIGLDYNFSGRGQVVQLTFEHDAITGNRAEAYYQIPRLWGSRQALTTNLGVGAEGHDVQVTFSRPFYTLSTRWGYGVSFFSQEQTVRLYTAQALSERYMDRTDGGSAWLIRSFGDRVKFRPNIRLDISDRRFAPHQGFTYAPEDRRRVLPSMGLTIWKPRFEQAQYIQFLGRREDLQLGSWVSTRAGFSGKDLGADQNFGFFQMQLAPRFKLYRNGYAFVNLFFSGRRQRGAYANLFAQAEILTYAQINRIHTMALRVRWDAVSRTEDASQLLLGSIRGLRGYAPRRFDGARRFLLNLEARPTLYRHAAFVLGGAFFVDGGTAWTPGSTSPSLNMSAGLGGRLGFTRIYNNPIMRADLAYGFQDRTWQLWVGLGQYF